MTNQSALLHRIIKANPEKVFREFPDPLAFSIWLPPHDFMYTVQQMEFKCATGLQLLQEGISVVIPAEMCYLGWQKSLEKLIGL